MAEFTDSDDKQLLERLSNGFDALQKQVDALMRHSEAMEKLLGDKRQVRLISHLQQYPFLIHFIQ